MNETLATFDLLFSDKVALQRRADNLEEAIAFYDKKIERLSDGVVRPWRTRRLEKTIARQAEAREELEFVNDELTFYSDVTEQPRDAYGVSLQLTQLSNGRDFGLASVTVTDSLFDETFESGDGLIVRHSGTRTKKNGAQSTWTSTVKTLAASTEVDGVSTFVFGSTGLGRKLANYDNITIDILDQDGDSIYSQSGIDVTNIV